MLSHAKMNDRLRCNVTMTAKTQKMLDVIVKHQGTRSRSHTLEALVEKEYKHLRAKK